MKFYITRTGYNYLLSIGHPKWQLEWGRWRWHSYNATQICTAAGNRLLKGLGLEPLKATEAHKGVLIQVKLNTRTKTWEATEWVMK